MEKRKQTPIDAHFKRNIKLKTGEMVQCLPSKIKNPEAHFLLPCEFPGCSKKCANKGAVANHMRFAHGNRIAVGSISSFVIRKPPNIIDCFKSLAISTLAMHLVSNASNLGPVPYLRPILRPFIPAEPEEKVDGRKFNRGEDHRVPINYLLKAKILDEYIEKKETNPTYGQDAHADRWKISQGQFSLWLKNRDRIFKSAADSKKKGLFKCRPSVAKYLTIEQALVQKFKDQRKEGRRVSARWFKKTARKIATEQNVEGFTGSKGWFCLFLRRYNLVLRKKTNSKRASVEEKRPIIANFHAKLRLFLSTGQNPHPKWGRFLPKNRWNVDQVPLPFSCQPSETYEQKGADRVWVKQNQAGLENLEYIIL